MTYFCVANAPLYSYKWGWLYYWSIRVSSSNKHTRFLFRFLSVLISLLLIPIILSFIHVKGAEAKGQLLMSMFVQLTLAGLFWINETLSVFSLSRVPQTWTRRKMAENPRRRPRKANRKIKPNHCIIVINYNIQTCNPRLLILWYLYCSIWSQCEEKSSRHIGPKFLCTTSMNGLIEVELTRIRVIAPLWYWFSIQ